MARPSEKLSFVLETVLSKNDQGESKKYDALFQAELVEFEVGGTNSKAAYVCSEYPLDQPQVEAERLIGAPVVLLDPPNTVVYHFPKMDIYLCVSYRADGAGAVVIQRHEAAERYNRWAYKAPGVFATKIKKKAE